MKICVFGLWHLGSVTAACLANSGHIVTGLDENEERIRSLQDGIPPISEPGLQDLIKKGISMGALHFLTEPEDALSDADIVWVTIDTPVDDDDHGDDNYVIAQIESLFPYLADETLVLISSQIPAGTTRLLKDRFNREYPGKRCSFAYSPENLRLGQALKSFLQPDRIVIGVENDADRNLLLKVLMPLNTRTEWMSIESAEMTKHAINAFLATSVTFANEIAYLCENIDADAKEVERGLKTDSRIGSRAYVAPGLAFAGGTLARDIDYLRRISTNEKKPSYLINAVAMSNEYHKEWIKRRALEALQSVDKPVVAIWGLTYKPGTNTLRRSLSLELCTSLLDERISVNAHDPAILTTTKELDARINLFNDCIQALRDANVLIIATAWPEYKDVNVDKIVKSMKTPTIIDGERLLADSCENDKRFNYIAVGKGV